MRGEGTGLELLIAPTFQALVQEIMPTLTPAPVRVLPEYQRSGLGRPDIAFALPESPARAFIELKAPGKSIEPGHLQGHDLDQFKRFGELPVWALTNFRSIRLYRRDVLIDEAEIFAAAAIDPATSDADAEALIRRADLQGFERILRSLAMAGPPEPRDAPEAAAILAHAARLVREVVLAQCRQGLDAVNAQVRAEFNETLFARAEAGGHDISDMDELFAGAFAQTLVFGLLLARDSGGGEDVDQHAYLKLPEATYSLLRGTLRALTLDEVREMLGVSFDISVDAVNSIAPELLAPARGRDPMLYLYEDFLRVFDAAAVARYGVYYTPPEIVELMVAETDRTLREQLGTDGLLDQNVQLLDPACGTGTFLIGAADSAARAAEARFGAGMVGPAISAFAQRMNGFELLVGPYTVAHYRMAREVLNRGGGVGHIPIYLTDTLAPPAGAAGVNTHLGFLGAPIVAEREAADRVKSDVPILAVIGNPPYKRLKRGEIERLVGRAMNERWDDLKQPVRQAGQGLSLNAFPDLCIAFYRWAMWRLFEADGALGRGTISFITNRTFLTSVGYGGLREMLRERFDTIRIIDFRGNNRGALPATVPADKNVFNIEVGVCVLIAAASGDDAEGDASVEYADLWAEGAFTRREKLDFAEAAAAAPERLRFQPVAGSGMARFKPAGFLERDWPSLTEILEFKSNGIVTYRDAFSYALSESALSQRIRDWMILPIVEATTAFRNSAMNKAADAQKVAFEQDAIEPISYRPFDPRFLYNVPEFVDRQRADLSQNWGTNNFALMSLSCGTGTGPAIWSHGLKPDQHSFRGSYGGWIFPLFNPAEGESHFLNAGLLAGLRAAYGDSVEPQDVYDAVLALLSASSYTTRFAHDLEDDFPQVPVPADAGLFDRAAGIGASIRELQGFRRQAGERFRTARLDGDAGGATLDIPTPARAFSGEARMGAIALLPKAALRIVGVSERAWQFNVSGYPVIYKWLKGRAGEALHGESGVALLRGALDLVWRVEELLALYDEADEVLRDALPLTLTRDELNLPPRGAAELVPEDDDGAE